MKTKLCGVLLFFSVCAVSQNFDASATVQLGGYYSTGAELPLWFYTNTFRSIGSESNFSSMLSGTSSYMLNETSSLVASASLYYRDNVANELERGEAFLEFKNSWLAIVLGAKENTTVAQGLSSTNKNFLWSQNARPLPGVLLETAKPLKLSNTFSVDAAIAHYSLNDNRYVNNTRVHYKHLALVTRFNENHTLTAKLQHVAQWAGTSPDFGQFPNDFKAYIDVFFAREGRESGEVGEVFNAIGNHLGTYLLDYEFKTAWGLTSLYHEHPFEDGSGTRLANFPDGVWGVYFQPENNSLVTGFLYEYVTTLDQSGSFGVGQDNYFGNRGYRSGWSYDSVIIGLPFIINDPELQLDSNTIAIVNNRVEVHHLGVAGTYRAFQWKLKSSFARSLGRFVAPFPKAQVTSHQYVEVVYTHENLGEFTLLTGFDTSNVAATNWGAGLTYRYSFNE